MSGEIVWSQKPTLSGLAVYEAEVDGIKAEVFVNYMAPEPGMDNHGWVYTLMRIGDPLSLLQGYGGMSIEMAKARAVEHARSQPFGTIQEDVIVRGSVRIGPLAGVIRGDMDFDKSFDGQWIYNEKEYARSQKRWLKHTGLKVGDEVLVNRLPVEKEGPWSSGWDWDKSNPASYTFWRCSVVSIDPTGICLQNPGSGGNHPVKFPYFCLYRYRYTIDFQRRVATVCNISHGGRRIAKNIALLGPGEKEDNTPRAREITLERALKQLDLPDNLKEILRDEAKKAPLSRMVHPPTGLEKMGDNWIIVNASGRTIPMTSSYARAEAINAFNQIYTKGWAHWRRKGFKCIKIESFIRRV